MEDSLEASVLAAQTAIKALRESALRETCKAGMLAEDGLGKHIIIITEISCGTNFDLD